MTSTLKTSDPLFIQIGDLRAPFTDAATASAQYKRFRDGLEWETYKATGRLAKIVKENGDQVGYISQNGRVWEGSHIIGEPSRLVYCAQAGWWPPESDPLIIGPMIERGDYVPIF